MTNHSSPRRELVRSEYQLDCAKVAGALTERLLTGRSLRLPVDTTEAYLFEIGMGARRSRHSPRKRSALPVAA